LDLARARPPRQTPSARGRMHRRRASHRGLPRTRVTLRALSESETIRARGPSAAAGAERRAARQNADWEARVGAGAAVGALRVVGRWGRHLQLAVGRAIRRAVALLAGFTYAVAASRGAILVRVVVGAARATAVVVMRHRDRCVHALDIAVVRTARQCVE